MRDLDTGLGEARQKPLAQLTADRPLLRGADFAENLEGHPKLTQRRNPIDVRRLEDSRTPFRMKSGALRMPIAYRDLPEPGWATRKGSGPSGGGPRGREGQ